MPYHATPHPNMPKFTNANLQFLNFLLRSFSGAVSLTHVYPQTTGFPPPCTLCPAPLHCVTLNKSLVMLSSQAKTIQYSYYLFSLLVVLLFLAITFSLWKLPTRPSPRPAAPTFHARGKQPFEKACFRSYLRRSLQFKINYSAFFYAEQFLSASSYVMNIVLVI